MYYAQREKLRKKILEQWNKDDDDDDDDDTDDDDDDDVITGNVNK